MDYQLFPIIVIIFSVPVLGAIINLRLRRNQPGATSLLYLMISILGWMVFNTIELVSSSENITLFFSKATYLFITATPVFWFFFMIEYIGNPGWKITAHRWIFWCIPAFTVLSVFTNDWHALFWTRISFVPVGKYLAMQVVHGPLYTIFWIYAQALIILSVSLLFRDNITKSNMYHWQVIWISIGVIIVFITSTIYTNHLIPGFQKDYTPVGLALSSLCFSIALDKFRLMGILPIGKTALFEALDDGILVVASDSTIVNINPSALRLLKVKEEDAIEKSLEEAFPFLPAIFSPENLVPKEQIEFSLSEQPPLYINLKCTPIVDHNKHLRGYLILLHDATHEKIIQISEHKERVFAEALSEIAAALNSAQNLEELLDLIISNVVQVTSCDSANIMMIEDGYAFAVRSLEPLKFWVKLPVDQTNNLRWMVENRSPMVMPDVRDFPEWVSIPETAGIQSYVGAPIVVVDEVIGFINLDSYTAGFYDQKTAERLSAFANQASIAFRNAQTMKKLEELASTDSLTEIFNRRCFFEMANREFERAKRYGLCLSTIMIDIDHFKKINDSYGHLAGDQVLRRVAQICVKEIRGTDIIGRYGGEEFAIVLPDTDIPEAQIVADRLCQHIAKEKVSTPSGEIGVTSSMGIAALDPACYRLEDLLEHSDIALYLAKHNGRNRAEIFSSDISLQAEDF